MRTIFSVIVEDFGESLATLRQLVNNGQDQKSTSAKARVALIQSSTLLLAATFEEFIREMAREYAVQIVAKANEVSDLPDALVETAWKRTLDYLARSKPQTRSKKEALEVSAKQARAKIDALCSFIEGDISQNIFDHLIHNDNNMRAGEVNRLFKLSGLNNVCSEICKQEFLKVFFDQDEDGKTHGILLSTLEDFFNRRNEIAHSLNSASSSGPDEIMRDINMFEAFSKDLGTTLDTSIS